jgi:lipopolysaccharide export system permease protein
MLSNKQLQTAIDSLQIKLEEKQQHIHTNIATKYKTNLQADSVEIIKDIHPIKKQQQYDVAIAKLRTLKSIVKGNKDDLEYREIIITKHKIEWHRKISLAVACVLLFFIGAPLGAIVKKGGFGLPVLIAVFFFLIYHVLSMISEKAAKDLSIEAYQGMWMTNAIFLPIAIFLIYKAKNDAQLFDFSKLKLSIFAHTKN